MENKMSVLQYAKLILAFVAALLLVIFAVQNAQEVDIRFWFWGFSASLSLILFVSIGVGVLLSILFTVFFIRKKERKFKPEEKSGTPEQGNQPLDEI